MEDKKNLSGEQAGKVSGGSGEGYVYSVDRSLCFGTSCGICFSDCTRQAINWDGGKASINSYLCTGCGKCKWSCPARAIY